MISETYTARHLRAQHSYQRSSHFHDINELLFSMNDGCRFFLNGSIYSVHRGVLVLIPEGALHRKINPDERIDVDTYTIHYPPSLLEAFSTPKCDFSKIFGSCAICVQVPEQDVEATAQLFERCTKEEDETFGSDLRRNLSFVELLLHLSPLVLSGVGKEVCREAIPPVVMQITEYINNHLDRCITLDKLAGDFFISKYNLCRQFKKALGFTIVEYINSSRIEKACCILREERRLNNLAERVGFPSQSHFIHTFRRYTGVTPRGYLERCQQFAQVSPHENFSPAKQDSEMEIEQK